MKRSGDGHLLNWRQTSTITQRQITTDSQRMMERTLIDADGSYCFYGKVLHQRGRDTHPDFSLASCIISFSLSLTLSLSLSFFVCLKTHHPSFWIFSTSILQRSSFYLLLSLRPFHEISMLAAFRSLSDLSHGLFFDQVFLIVLAWYRSGLLSLLRLG